MATRRLRSRSAHHYLTRLLASATNDQVPKGYYSTRPCRTGMILHIFYCTCTYYLYCAWILLSSFDLSSVKAEGPHTTFSLWGLNPVIRYNSTLNPKY